MKRRRLIKEVKLQFLKDERTGKYGVAPENIPSDSFNAFWGAPGIFHDVFEHNHEITHKYFRGQYSLNVGGEIAAMGASWYYLIKMGVSLYSNSARDRQRGIRLTIKNLLLQHIEENYLEFGDELLSAVPKQSPIKEETGLSQQIEFLWEEVKCMKPSSKEGRHYKNSVTLRKISDLFRYGYRLAERLVPDSFINLSTLYSFMELWDKFCKRNSAEELHHLFYGITFKLFRRGKDIEWQAILDTRYWLDVKDIKLTEDNIEDFWAEDMHYHMY